MASIFTFNASSTAAVLDYTQGLFTDLNFLLVLIIGLPLGFWIIRKVIGLVRAR